VDEGGAFLEATLAAAALGTLEQLDAADRSPRPPQSIPDASQDTHGAIIAEASAPTKP
jgi:hypothetical protein